MQKRATLQQEFENSLVV